MAASALAIAAMRELAWLITPLLVSGLIAILVHPLYAWLVARRVPRPVALTILLSAAYGLLIGLGTVIVYALIRFASMLPAYADRFQTMLEELARILQEIGVEAPQFNELWSWIDARALASWLTDRIPSVALLATMLIFLGTVLVFVGIESTQVRLRTRTLRHSQPELYEALAKGVVRTRRFLAVTTLFAVIVGLLDTLFLLAVGVPFAVLWGLLAAVCNYIPYLGFWIGMTPPALLALILTGWQSMLLVIIVYIVLNFVITSLIPTKFIADAVGSSMTLEVIAIVFWAWVLGPIGAILAVPLTIFLKAVFVDSDPSARWLDELVGSAKSLQQSDSPRPHVDAVDDVRDH